MYNNTIGFNIDWKRKTMYAYLDNDEAVKIDIDDEGNGVLSVELFKTIQIGSLKRFIEELKTLVSKEQMVAILTMWGNSSAIKLGVLADLLQDRELAKAVIRLGSQRGVIVVGVNSTWKVIGRDEQKTMKEYAERSKRVVSSSKPILEEELTELPKEEETNSGEAGSIITSSTVVKTEHIANKPSSKVVVKSVEELQKELTTLEKRLQENKDWDENETPHTVVEKINKIKNQLRMLAINKVPQNIPTKKPLAGKIPTRKKT